jgi:hypothetical protein
MTRPPSYFAIAVVDVTDMTPTGRARFIRRVATLFNSHYPWSAGMLGCGVRLHDGFLEIQQFIRSGGDDTLYHDVTLPALIRLKGGPLNPTGRPNRWVTAGNGPNVVVN